jgi:hypothetical protein
MTTAGSASGTSSTRHCDARSSPPDCSASCSPSTTCSIFLRGRETTLPLYVWAQASSHTSNVPLIYALSTVVLLVSLVVITGAFWLLFARGEANSEKAKG